MNIRSMIFFLLVGISGCKHERSSVQTLDEGPSNPGSDADFAPTADALKVTWQHGQADCSKDPDPAFQKYQFDADTVILRQDKCLDYEAPFIYLLFGKKKVLMLDSGSLEIPDDVSEADAHNYALRKIVDETIGDYESQHGLDSLQLVVAHTHGHRDHAAGDALFAQRAHTQVVGLGVPNVMNFWKFSSMQGAPAAFDLGGRILDAMPLPGHFRDHIALYDRQSRILLTGDSLYAGLLTIDSWTDYRASIARLAAFAQNVSITYILGAHVEMSTTPGQFYPIGSTWQEHEHPLELFPKHLKQLNQALINIGPIPHFRSLGDFVIGPE